MSHRMFSSSLAGSSGTSSKRSSGLLHLHLSLSLILLTPHLKQNSTLQVHLTTKLAKPITPSKEFQQRTGYYYSPDSSQQQCDISDTVSTRSQPLSSPESHLLDGRDTSSSIPCGQRYFPHNSHMSPSYSLYIVRSRWCPCRSVQTRVSELSLSLIDRSQLQQTIHTSMKAPHLLSAHHNFLTAFCSLTKA